VYIVMYIHSELLASITCDLFHPTITITLLVHVTLIEEHCEEAYEEALKYATHCVILSVLLSVELILYNGVLVLSSETVAAPWQNRNRSVADRW